MPEVKTLITGLGIGESPRWHNGLLWFSNWGLSEVVAVTPAGQREATISVPTGVPFCIDRLPAPDGRLLVVAGREGLLLSLEGDGSLVTYANLTGLSAHPWNEIVVDSRGNSYVNNTGFDFPAGEFAPGMIALVAPDGSVRRVADGLAFPNGMAVTPDNSTLIVAESYGNRLTAFSIADDGTLHDRRVWASMEGCYPDGICLDADGAVWYGDVPNHRCVRVREGGEVLQTIDVDGGCFACTLGGEDGNTLYMMVAQWAGLDALAEDAKTGKVLFTSAPAPRAGYP